MRCWSDLLGNPLWPTNCGKGLGMLEKAFIRQWSLVTGVTHSSGAWTLRGGEGRIDFTRAKSSSLPSGKLTWQCEIHHLKMYSLVKMEIFHCYVSLPEGNPLKSDHKCLISEKPFGCTKSRNSKWSTLPKVEFFFFPRNVRGCQSISQTWWNLPGKCDWRHWEVRDVSMVAMGKPCLVQRVCEVLLVSSIIHINVILE